MKSNNKFIFHIIIAYFIAIVTRLKSGLWSTMQQFVYPSLLWVLFNPLPFLNHNTSMTSLYLCYVLYGGEHSTRGACPAPINRLQGMFSKIPNGYLLSYPAGRWGKAICKHISLMPVLWGLKPVSIDTVLH